MSYRKSVPMEVRLKIRKIEMHQREINKLLKIEEWGRRRINNLLCVQSRVKNEIRDINKSKK